MRAIDVYRGEQLPDNLENTPAIMFNGRLFEGDAAFEWVHY